MQKVFQEKLQQPAVQAFLDQGLLARMATSNPRNMQPHVVPVWYEWDGKNVWIHTFYATRKVRELLDNPRISVVIDTMAEDQAPQMVIFEGLVKIIDDVRVIVPRANSIYRRYLGEAGALEAEPQSWIHDPESRLIKVTPERVIVQGIG